MKTIDVVKKLTAGVLVGLLSLGVAAPVRAAGGGGQGIMLRKDVFAKGVDGYNTYRIPTMVATAKGTLLLFVEGRVNSRRDSGNIDMLLKRSEDGGKTWSKQIVILDEPGRVGNSCAIVEQNGKTVHLLFTRGGGECFFHTKSSDEGKTWSKLIASSDRPDQKEYKKTNFLKDFGGSPVQIGAGPVHGVHTKTGRLIAPSYIGRTTNGKRVGNCTTIYSDDGGKSWRPGGLVPNNLAGGECTMVIRSDGSYMMNMRAGSGYRAISTSSDRGVTWSKAVLDKNLPEPSCQASIIRLNDKEILFSNPAVHWAGSFAIWSRRNLTLRLSKDDGRTWPHARCLNEGLAGYSDIAVTTDGRIFCAFENGINDYCDKISVVQVDRKWLIEGKAGQKKKKAITASFCGASYLLSAVADGVEPKSSNDQGVPRFAWWDHLGTKEWVQHSFTKPRKVSAVEVYWYANRGVQVPKSWRLLYLSGKEWKAVPGSLNFATAIDKYNRVAFKPISTTALRIEVQLQPRFSGGILEWKIQDAK
jgi:sialidase-1